MVGLVIPVLFVILGDQVRNELVFSSAKHMMLTTGLCLWGWGGCVYLCFCFVLCFETAFSCSPSWSETHCVTQTRLELKIVLP